MIDLSKFTDPNDTRGYCRVQLRLNDGRVVATDGYKLVCVDSFDGDVSALMAAPERQDESICKMLAAHSGATHWQPVASLNIPAPDPCVKCMGSGALIATKCEECDGDGEFEHGRYTYDCQECGGNGTTDTAPCAKDNPDGEECSKCFGTGHKRTPVPVPGLPDDRAVDAKYLSAFPPDAEIAAMPSNGSHMIALRGAGWIGVLMPMQTR